MATVGPAIGERITRIAPRSGLRLPDVREVIESRELLYLLAWRDVKIRYKQTVLGAGWAVIQPVLTMVVFSLVFGRVGKVPSDGLPYPLFSLGGLVIWSYFSNALVLGSNSLVSNVALLTKVYFPRILVPMAALLAGLVDLGISFLVLLAVMAGYGVAPTLRMLTLPLILVMLVAVSLGVSAGLGALNVRYRDVRYVVPFLSQLWLLATPVAYPASLLDERWRTVMALNPMAGVVEGFRWAVLDTQTHPGVMVAVSAASSVVFLVVGIMYFAKVERGFADVA
jgi:lipopolysaccharide transport system permease protein